MEAEIRSTVGIRRSCRRIMPPATSGRPDKCFSSRDATPPARADDLYRGHSRSRLLLLESKVESSTWAGDAHRQWANVLMLDRKCERPFLPKHRELLARFLGATIPLDPI
jgi:hypothetical protein